MPISSSNVVSLLCLLFLLAAATRAVFGCDTTYSSVVHVDCENGSTGSDCGTVGKPCNSLAVAVTLLHDNTCISIPTSQSCHLDGVVNITGYSNISISGNEGLSLVCTDNTAGGLYVSAVEGLALSYFTISGCGAMFDTASYNISSSTMTRVRVALYVINVTNLAMTSTHFQYNPGLGLAVYNTNGNVEFVNCDFISNSVPEYERSTTAGGGGMLLHYSYCTPGLITCDPSTNTYNSNNRITIDSCRFQGNHATKPTGTSDEINFHKEERTHTFTLGKGGGLGISFSGNSSQNSVTVKDSVFYNNSAHFGGGLQLLVKDFASGNDISIVGTEFEANFASGDGGGLRLANEFYECKSCVLENTVTVNNTWFLSNLARWGGGVEYFASQGEGQTTSSPVFYNCTWDSNVANMSASAVDLVLDAFSAQLPGFLPTPLFERCVFVSNSLGTYQTGTVSIQSYEVQFHSHVKFQNNTGTPLYLTDATAVILNGTLAEFVSNTASNGAALSLLGSSNIIIHPDTHIYFTNNKALEFGGAIYFYSTSPSMFYSYTCFIEYFKAQIQPGNWSNVTLSFSNNTALGFGHAIYASTLLPCARIYGNGSTMEDKLDTLFARRPFIYSDPYIRGLIGTVAHHIGFDSYIPLVAIPGLVFQTGVQAFDELNQTVDAVFHAFITKGSENASIGSTYSYTASGQIELTGLPGARVELSLQTTGPIQTETSLEIMLTECPPGFYKHLNASSTICKCSANVHGHQYGGVFRCDTDDFHAILAQGYWGGCLSGTRFVTGQCPLGFCNQTNNQDFILPQSCAELDTLLCGPKHRTGILCGECIENYTVHYHSNRYECEKCKHPHLGLLYYTLAELLPLTLVFAVIVVFGISFTSGPANSFIFFAQVLNFFDVSSLDSLRFPKPVTYLGDGYQTIFGAFNFDFFKSEVFSFCLWDNAQILDIFVFKYITTAYVLVMLLSLLLSVHYIRCCYACLQWCVFRRTITICLIQGVSALLIMSYAQCAKVSFQILTVQSLRGQDFNHVKDVVFLSGKTDYFSPHHLPYAIPAVLVLVLVTIPPLILILHPTLTKYCGKGSNDTGEERKKMAACFSMWKTRLTPFFDSFQSCFKDNCRYFAGLYFIYRLAISMAFAFSDNGMELYFTLEIIVILMLAIHAIVQPYQKPFFNIVDAAIFADLAIINGLSIYNFYWAQKGVEETVTIVSYFQVFLIYLPLVYMVAVLLLKAGMKFRKIRSYRLVKRLRHYVPLDSNQTANYRLQRSSSFSENNLPSRLFEEQPASYGATANSTGARNTL